MAVVYDTVVTAVGEQAGTFFAEGVVILFGEDAPEELAEYSVIHRPTVTAGGVAPGAVVELADEQLHVLAVGDVADDNLVNIGHLVLKRNGADAAALPGDVCCDAGPIPPLAPGDRVRITTSTGAPA